MPAPKRWEHFGGRKDGQQGNKPLESELIQWARERGFTPVQAQAKLCHEKLYARTYRSTTEIRKEFMPGMVQMHNRSRQSTATGEPSKVSIFKGKLNPMHLLVQTAYYKDKVCLTLTHQHLQADQCCNVNLDTQAALMQALNFDAEAWAVEHFQLESSKVQEQLTSYLQLLSKPDIDKEGMPANVDTLHNSSGSVKKP